jgi:DNA-binding beta-propeller fold protein YncE
VGGVFAETPDRVFIFARGCLPELTDGSFGEAVSIIPSRNASGYDLSRSEPERHPKWSHVLYTVDRNGKLVENWDQYNDMFVRPHRVKINPYDPERHVWTIDDGAEQVTKFTHDGKQVVLQLGEFKVRGSDASHFGRPTDIAWLPDGTFFVSDGYVNTRVAKFDKDGEFILDWGKKGDNSGTETRPYYMNTVHGIAIDDNRRVYVIDRTNNRIQIFDENGKFIEDWRGIKRPYYIYMSADQHLWVSDAVTQKFLKMDLATGKVLYDWGSFGSFPGGNWGVHQFSVDSEGNFYTADVHVGRVQKYRPKPGADPSHLVGQWRPLSGSASQ